MSPLSAAAFARAIGEPLPTVKRWLRAWHAQGVAGVARVPARGRYGAAYAVAPDVPARWRRCELPVPRVSA